VTKTTEPPKSKLIEQRGKYLTTQFSSSPHVPSILKDKASVNLRALGSFVFQRLIFMRVDNFTHLPHLLVPTYDKDPFDLWLRDMSNIELL
jgi:hypothetical protein